MPADESEEPFSPWLNAHCMGAVRWLSILLYRIAPAPARWCAVSRRAAHGEAALARPNIYEKLEDLQGSLGGGWTHTGYYHGARIEPVVAVAPAKPCVLNGLR
jgi:hypothetical protein